jgi:CRISPR/Cas system CSM-associated protein Csm3 (group 7 of RAMP superfamily)
MSKINSTKYCNNNYYLELLLLQKINNLEIDNIKSKKELLRVQNILNYNSEFKYENIVNIRENRYLKYYYINDNKLKLDIIKLKNAVYKMNKTNYEKITYIHI